MWNDRSSSMPHTALGGAPCGWLGSSHGRIPGPTASDRAMTSLSNRNMTTYAAAVVPDGSDTSTMLENAAAGVLLRCCGVEPAGVAGLRA